MSTHIRVKLPGGISFELPAGETLEVEVTRSHPYPVEELRHPDLDIYKFFFGLNYETGSWLTHTYELEDRNDRYH